MKKAIIIFGSTGNLTYKKLLPAVSALIEKKQIVKGDKIFLIARKEINLDEYIKIAQEKVKEKVNWDLLSEFLEYFYLEIENVNEYDSLKKLLAEKDFQDNTFYLALPPALFPTVAEGINKSGLVKKGEISKRIVFEKPFGENLYSAEEINKQLWNYFDESQIYRIDHYLGKEMIQNILVVRFANKIFEQTWNHNTIRNIIIVAKETEGVMSRGGYYDKIGALKDMLQSHLLQMAALIGMKKPKSFSSEDIKNEKIKVLNDLRVDLPSIILGQYDGYLKEEKVNLNSNTETFIFARAYIDNKKWKNTPIYFISGKKLDEKRSEIIINFKDDSNLVKIFNNAKPNNTKLIIKVAPEAGVKFQLNVKQPGLGNEIIPGNLDYCHTCNWVGNTSEAYEKLLLDIITNNKTLFTRWDEIEAMWRIVDDIEQKKTIFVYKDYEDIKNIIKIERGVDISDL